MDSKTFTVKTEIKLTERKAKVIDLTMRGWTQQRIAGVVGVSQVQVGRDIKEVVDEWRAEYLQGIDEIKMKEVKRIEHILAAHWEELEESKYRTIPAKIDTKTGKPVKGALGKDRKVRVPANIEYLQGIRECVMMLWKIYGIGQDASPTNNTLNVFNVDKLTETLRAVAVEQESSRLAEVERLQLAEQELAARTPSEEMTSLEKLEAMRARDDYNKSKSNQTENGHVSDSSQE